MYMQRKIAGVKSSGCLDLFKSTELALYADIFMFFSFFLSISFVWCARNMKQLQIFTFLFKRDNILSNKKIRVGAKN